MALPLPVSLGKWSVLDGFQRPEHPALSGFRGLLRVSWNGQRAAHSSQALPHRSHRMPSSATAIFFSAYCLPDLSIGCSGDRARKQIPLPFRNRRVGARLGRRCFSPFTSPRARFLFPPITKTTDFLADAGITGNIFNHPSWGSSLVYRLYPKIKVAHTMRLQVHRDLLELELVTIRSSGSILLPEILKKYPETI